MKIGLNEWEMWTIIDGLHCLMNTIEGLDMDEDEEEYRIESINNLSKIENKIRIAIKGE